MYCYYPPTHRFINSCWTPKYNALVRGNGCFVLDMATGQDLDTFIAELQSGQPVQYTVDKRVDVQDSSVVIFTDQKGQKLVLKQKRDLTSPYHMYTLVLETVGSRIAEELNLPINRVRIIPPSLEFNLKPFPGYPATLHSFVEGIPIEGVGIQQRVGKGIPLEETGLTYSVIKNMSKNLDLAQITALDTFLGNADRHDWNLFFSNGHYTGFDMGDIFQRNLVDDALRQLRRMHETGVRFTPQEMQGLMGYRDTLRNLRDGFPLEKIYVYMNEATAESGLRELRGSTGKPLYDQGTVDYFKKNARDNLAHINELLSVLDSILTGDPVPQSPVVHTVKPGETLWIISRMYGVTIPEIVAANKLANPDIIHTGQKLLIPKDK